MDDLRPLSYAVISVLYVIASITICMRIYVRGFTMRAFGWDDWAMAAMLIFNSCQQAILYFFLEFGAGLHITEVVTEHPEWIPVLMKGLLTEEFWYIWMQFVVKMCFLLFYFRLSKTLTFRRFLWGVIGFHTATTIVIWLLYGLQCMPLAAFYDSASYPDVKCLDTNITYFVPYTLNMATDMMILILPLPVIWTLQMTLKRRLAVLAVLTTGGSAVLTSGLRAIILFEFSSSPDFTWSLGKMVIISNVEMQVGIVAANMPALKAFWTCWRQNMLGPGQGTGLEHNSGQRGKTSKTSQSDLEMNSGVHASRSRNTRKGGRTPDPMTLTMTESEEKLFERKNGLKVKTEYESSMQSSHSN